MAGETRKASRGVAAGLGLAMTMRALAAPADEATTPVAGPGADPSVPTGSFTPPTSAQPSAAPPAAALAQPPDWANAYREARQFLTDGKFGAASARFFSLASGAQNSLDRELALELGRLAAAWQAAGVSLVDAKDLEDSTLVARRDNRRTTDEISVLYVNGILYGLGSGLLVAVHTQPDSPAGVVLPALLLGGAGAGAVALIDSGRGLGYGVPQAIVSGMYIGLGEGITWSVWNQAHVRYNDEWSAKTVANVVWGAATLGAIGGGALGSAYGSTPGRASYVGSAALWTSAVAGLATGASISDVERQDDGALLAAAIGLNAGVVGGVLTASAVAPSIARVRYLDLGGLAGGLTFGGLYVSAAGRNPDVRAIMGISALGIVGGLSTAWALTNGMPKDRLADDRPGTGFVPGGITVGRVPGGATVAVYGSL